MTERIQPIGQRWCRPKWYHEGNGGNGPLVGTIPYDGMVAINSPSAGWLILCDAYVVLDGERIGEEIFKPVNAAFIPLVGQDEDPGVASPSGADGIEAASPDEDGDRSSGVHGREVPGISFPPGE